MTWADYDSAVYHYQLRLQQQLEGHRLVATMLFNAWFTNSDGKHGPIVKSKSPAELMPLSMIDPPAAMDTRKETQQQTWARMKEAGLLD